jgi:hypothetical protein
MMETVGLQGWRIRAKSAFELAFPKGYPVLQRVILVLQCTEKMNVIRHDHVISHEPSVG